MVKYEFEYNSICGSVSAFEVMNRYGCILPDHEDREKAVYKCCFHNEDTPSLTVWKGYGRAKGAGFHCFGCGKSGDCIKLAAMLRETSYTDAARLIDSDFNLRLFPDRPKPVAKYAAILARNNRPPAPKPPPAPPPPPPKDRTEELKRYRDNFFRDRVALDYWKRRGFSLETARRHVIGSDLYFCKGEFYPSLIIGFSKYNYTRRFIDRIPPDGERYKNLWHVPWEPFNMKAVYENAYCFVCEGAFNALSIEECGHPAMAINGTSNYKNLVQRLTETPPAAHLILALDDDNAGRGAQAALAEGLQAHGFAFSAPALPGICEGVDFNDLLCTNRQELERILKEGATL